MALGTSSEMVAIVGGGSIGVGWSIVFAAAGCPVTLHDPDPARLAAAAGEIAALAEALVGHDLIPGPAAEIIARIGYDPVLQSAIAQASYVQECAPEILSLKRQIFADFAANGRADTVFASSSSAIPIRRVVEDLAIRQQCLVVHPLNPPYLLRVVEIAPAEFTAPDVVARSEGLIRAAGLTPIVVGKEIEGFVFNRLQGALLREAYCLVRDGVATVDDIDAAVTLGLGLRWSVIGPFETADLNTRGGIASHAVKMGPAYARMGADRGQKDPWTDDLVAKVTKARRERLSLEDWNSRVEWRDARLMELVQLLQNGSSRRP